MSNVVDKSVICRITCHHHHRHHHIYFRLPERPQKPIELTK